MNVIVFASRKGGSGKSTLAAHLAAQVHKSTKPCLLIDADPQGSLTLWHKLRGTNEPPIKAAVNSVSGIVAAARRDGIESSTRRQIHRPSSKTPSGTRRW
jgi:chromosome partitioning protein